MTRQTLLAVAFLTSMANGRPVEATDACEAKVPQALGAAIKQHYPGYRPVRATDYSPEDIARERQYHAGSRCLGVATADIDGDGRLDVGLLIVSKGGRTLFIAGRNVKTDAWQLEKLWDFGTDGPSRVYVNSLDPGNYEDLGLAETMEPGEVMKYTSSRPGLITGTMEASGIAFFFTGTGWIHLWVQD